LFAHLLTKKQAEVIHLQMDLPIYANVYIWTVSDYFIKEMEVKKPEIISAVSPSHQLIKIDPLARNPWTEHNSLLDEQELYNLLKGVSHKKLDGESQEVSVERLSVKDVFAGLFLHVQVGTIF
jgi:hypothetical protein